MTNRIYETDSYIREIETVVTAAGIDEKGRPYICLEDTIFFPEEGGQNADTGTLTVIKDTLGQDEEIRVLNGIITGRNTCSSSSSDSEISIKYIVSALLDEGTKVLCRLDWDMRYDRMQNHSGEHVVSGLIHSGYGLDNVGFHLSDTGFVTLDFNGVLDYEQVLDVERKANRVIYANIPIKDSYPTKDELSGMEYRSKIDIDGQVRLITIGDDECNIDVCACCAPHVGRTGEIGIIKIMSVINWKGGIRISMLCGRRALEYINREHDILTETARILSTEIVNVPEIVKTRGIEMNELKAKLSAALEKNVADRIGSGDADKTGCVFVEGDFPQGSMKNIYNVLGDRLKDRYVGVFAGNDADGYRYFAGSREKDSRELSGRLRDALGAKGGGNAEMIQGKISGTEAEIKALFSDL